MIYRSLFILGIVVVTICFMGLAVFGVGAPQQLALAALLTVFGLGNIWIAILGVYRGTTPASIGGVIQFSRSAKPFFFWINCIGHFCLGAMTTVTAASVLLNFIR